MSRTLEVLCGLAGGWGITFITMTLLRYTPFADLAGQLIAGDPEAGRAYPTTLGMVQDTAGAVSSAGPYLFWIAVIVIGTPLGLLLLRAARRFV